MYLVHSIYLASALKLNLICPLNGSISWCCSWLPWPGLGFNYKGQRGLLQCQWQYKWQWWWWKRSAWPASKRIKYAPRAPIRLSQLAGLTASIVCTLPSLSPSLFFRRFPSNALTNQLTFCSVIASGSIISRGERCGFARHLFVSFCSADSPSLALALSRPLANRSESANHRAASSINLWSNQMRFNILATHTATFAICSKGAKLHSIRLNDGYGGWAF